MKLYVCLLVVIMTMTTPNQALLGAKLALIGALRNSFESAGTDAGYSGGYGNGYRSDYGYGKGNYFSGKSYNRPVYTGRSSNYGWGQQAYGSGYNGGYNSGYNGGSGETVRVIKVIVNREPPQGYYENYAKNLAASTAAVSTTSGATWTPLPAPAPASVVQTYTAQPAESVQISAPATNQIPVQISSTVPAQVIQPPRPVFVQPYYTQQSPAGYQPIQYSVQQPQAIFRQTQPIYQQPQTVAQSLPQFQNSYNVIVDGETQNAPAPTYGPPQPVATYVTPSADNTGTWNSDSWSNANSGKIGTGLWKKGGIWESFGC